MQWLVSLLPGLQDSGLQQQPQEQQDKAASRAQQQAVQELLTSLLSGSGVAAATDTSSTHAQALVSTARQFHGLILQLRPSLEQLLSIRDRVSLQQLLSLPPDDARVVVLMADHAVSTIHLTGSWQCFVAASAAFVGP